MLAGSRAALADVPNPRELARVSPSGIYLAARHAGTHREIDAASAYYQAALKLNPNNPDLLERAFFALLADGDIPQAAKLAERLVQSDRTNSIARLVLGVRAIKLQQFATARQHLSQSLRGPIADLTSTLLIGWAELGANRVSTAVQTIDRLNGPEWYALFKDLHAGLILDAAGRKRSAGKYLERAYQADKNALRAVQGYAYWASRNLGTDKAANVLETFEKVVPRQPLIVSEIQQLKNGETLPPLIGSARLGAAEVLYGLGAAIGRQGGEDLGLIYLRLSLYLAPRRPLALLSLADLFEALKKPKFAVATYEKVPPGSPLRRNAEIQIALNLDTLERTEEARQRLDRLIAERGGDIDAMIALGNILRSRKQYAECAEVYSKVLDTPAGQSNWGTYYYRGICHERAKQWPKAEADFLKALEMQPDQPQVLNYLGYSWVDQGVHLDRGLEMIRRAVEKRPDDGAIVDSLGWAYYRLGNYPEAVKHLEQAVGLNPQDPTINDHLGDAYWRVGRILEARFQWAHARDLKPEPDELVRIQEKLRVGLGEETSTSAEANKPGNGG